MEKKGLGRPNWDEAFMFAAISAATRASCLTLKTGAVIVKDKRVISMGYNGAPPGITSCLEKGCRKKEHGVSFDKKDVGLCRGVHAEVNAMSQISRDNLKGTKMYTVFFPCSSCAKAIVTSGISEVIYSKVYREPDSLTKELFSEAGVRLRQLKIDVKSQCNRIIDINKQEEI